MYDHEFSHLYIDKLTHVEVLLLKIAGLSSRNTEVSQFCFHSILLKQHVKILKYEQRFVAPCEAVTKKPLKGQRSRKG